MNKAKDHLVKIKSFEAAINPRVHLPPFVFSLIKYKKMGQKNLTMNRSRSKATFRVSCHAKCCCRHTSGKNIQKIQL